MGRFSPAIVGLGKNRDSDCFLEVARGLSDAIRSLGHEVVPHTDPNPGRFIIFGFQQMTDEAGIMPKDAIFYNTEQTAAVSEKVIFQAHETYRDRVVWDYSRANAEKLRGLGLKRVVLCPVGYVPSMTKFEPKDEDIDVLFYGSLNLRRVKILQDIQERGLSVVRLFGVYGEERDKKIARAKVILNMHFYEGGVFEIFRVSHALSNKCLVVTERGGCDSELEALAEATCTTAPYGDELVNACVHAALLPEAKRRELAMRGHEAFKKVDFSENARLALLESAP